MSIATITMRHQRALLVAVSTVLLASAAQASPRHHRHSPDEPTDSVLQVNADSLFADSVAAVYTNALAQLTQALATVRTSAKVNPYMFPLVGPATLWNGALAREMSISLDDADEQDTLGSSDDSQLELLASIHQSLGHAYTSTPQLFATTENEVMSTTRLRSDLSRTVRREERLSSQAQQERVSVNIAPVEVQAQRPNFWTTKGNGGLQFTQNYFSGNWYQGGEKNYSMLGLLTVDANFDNKQRIQWDNRFEAQLGFQTSESTKPKFRSTSNLLRLTSKLGVKAVKKWNYAAQLQLQSQPYMTYDGSGENITADFLSPLYVRSSLGMDYKFSWKRLSGSLYLAPLSYNITYVDRNGLLSRYGIHTGHHSKHDWGPNINLTFTYQIMDNIKWTSRAYWFSNLSLTRIEWENTFDFKVNRYISAKLFLYPRFEDSSVSYRAGDNHDGTYWMFKEFLSLGLNYDF